MAIDLEELEPKGPAKGPKPLDRLSAGDLEEYRARLVGEIARVDAEMERRRGQRAAAESLFKS